MPDLKPPVTRGPAFFAFFLLGDLLLLAAAAFLFAQSHRPMLDYEMAGFGACVALAAWFGCWPWILRQRAELKLAETAELTRSVSQIQRIEEVARRIETATSQWHTIQEHAARTNAAAREIADRMVAEQKSFQTFLEQANDAERSHLRLEVNKLRRAEGEWLQIVVRILDHVYALYSAGVRSGQPQLTEQLGNFQHACRETARRVGLIPILAAPGAPFDPNAHQLLDAEVQPAPDAIVAETLATGYAFQGQLLRRAVVSLRATETPPEAPPGEPITAHWSVSDPAASDSSAPAEPPADSLPPADPPADQDRDPATTVDDSPPDAGTPNDSGEPAGDSGVKPGDGEAAADPGPESEPSGDRPKPPSSPGQEQLPL